MSKNIAILFVTLGLLLTLAIITFEFLAAAQAKHYPNRRAVEFYTTYMDKLHHLRDPKPNRWKLDENPRNALYTIVREFANDLKSNILIQGDSWAEQFVESPQTLQYLSTIARTSSTGLVVAGISSYAPSPMTMQLRIIRKDFDMHPNKIIAVIDQTDLGDEICRYNLRRKLGSQKELVAVTPEPIDSMETFSLTEYFEHSQIWSSRKLGILQYIDRLKHGFTTWGRKEIPQRCTFSNITKLLDGNLSQKEEEIFVNNLLGYIAEVFSEDGFKTLYFVTHPHRGHVQPDASSHRHQIDISTLVHKAIKQSKWQPFIKIIDFHFNFHQHYQNWEINKIFREGDPGSHLTDEAHATVYSKHILSKVMSDGRDISPTKF